ncbi:MAG: hypothetical protein K9W43_10415 [Candidatus Thorarchaeota archaeon]|nr:hypothetical protein [Candidatus Thorarchaeota archaeon]
MDFFLALQISLVVSSVIMAISLAIFVQSYRRTSHRLGSATKRALILFGLSAVVYQVSISLSVVNLMLSRVLFSFGPLLLDLSLFEIIFESRTTRIKAIATFITFYFSSLFLIALDPAGPFKYFSMVIIVGVLFLLTIRLHMVSPSPFTYSSLGIALITVPLYFTVMYGFILIEPHYFPGAVLGVTFIAAILASMLKPWRMIPSLFLIFFGTTLAIPVIYAAIVAGDAGIYIFVFFAYMVSLALVLPFEYFVAEAVHTHTRTPLYIAITLFSIGLLVETHWTNWAYSYGTSPAVGLPWDSILLMKIHGNWDQWIIFMDWILGVVAVSVFLLAALSTTYSERVTEPITDLLIVIGVPLVLLMNPWINSGRYDSSILYLPMLILILIAAVAYGRLAWRLVKMGHGRVAVRFVIFIVGAISAGLVSMFSDRMPFIMDPVLQIVAIVMLMFSAPGNPVRRFIRILRGTDLDQEAV